MNNQKNSGIDIRSSLIYAAGIFDLVGSVVGGAVIGYFIDKKMNTNGLFSGSLAFIGFLVGVGFFIKIIKIKRGKADIENQ